MKRIVFAGISASFLMSGCAPVPYTKADLDGRVVCHPDVMDAVAQEAKRKFTQVIWVRCPTATLRVI